MTPGENPNWVTCLTPTLFWDVDQTKLDAKEHLKTILERVLERGFWQDWTLVASHVPKSDMVALVPRLRVPQREINFLKSFLEIDDPHQ